MIARFNINFERWLRNSLNGYGVSKEDLKLLNELYCGKTVKAIRNIASRQTAGRSGTIVTVEFVDGISFGVDFGESYLGSYLHNLNGTLDTQTGLWAYPYELEPMKFDKIPKELAVCERCGTVLPISYLQTVKTKHSTHYLCSSCLKVKDYSVRNNKRVHLPKKHGKTYGFEFEVIPRNTETYNILCLPKYALIPTHDASLPSRGVEFKSPTYQSLCGVRKIFQLVYDNADTTHSQCGQHINIGDTRLNGQNMKTLSRYAPQIFAPLVSVMRSNSATTQRIWGRYFVDYATVQDVYTSHYSWINLSHNNRIEFRLAKMRSPQQYFELTCMCTEFVDCLFRWYLSLPASQRNTGICGEKLVAIYKKYVDGKAQVQLRTKAQKP